MASTRAAPLARWSVAAAVALMGAALVVTAWTTRGSVRDARDTLLRGERAALEQAVRADLAELDHAPADDDLAAIVAAHRDAGLRYVAVIDGGGGVRAAAGKPSSSPDLERIELRVPRRGRFGDGGLGGPGGPGGLGGLGSPGGLGGLGGPTGPGGFGARRGGGRVVIELVPVEAQELDEAATRTLEIGFAAAAVLIVVASFLVRWVLRRERLERERERERRLASLGELSAVLAHEIRNPLASLKGNAQLLAGSLPAGEKPRQKAERVVDEALRLEALTNDLLEFVRTGEIRRVDADPAALLRDCAAAGGGDAAIELVNDGAPAAWPLDAPRMRQVLVNLIENAVAAGPPVRARVALERDRLVFEIGDHGPGVPDEDVERIFEPFFTRKTSGTGLGLAVARRVVDQHGGTISVRGAPGGGALFRVELPRA